MPTSMLFSIQYQRSNAVDRNPPSINNEHFKGQIQFPSCLHFSLKAPSTPTLSGCNYFFTRFRLNFFLIDHTWFHLESNLNVTQPLFPFSLVPMNWNFSQISALNVHLEPLNFAASPFLISISDG
uniref:Uncharacterized protein n=1 Tax=Chlorocebus sabaeus TaxID=60711 RepID=A0A0D9RDW1_CHLSB